MAAAKGWLEVPLKIFTMCQVRRVKAKIHPTGGLRTGATLTADCGSARGNSERGARFAKVGRQAGSFAGTSRLTIRPRQPSSPRRLQRVNKRSLQLTRADAATIGSVPAVC